MSDSNPQLGRDLRVLEFSEGMVPFVTCLRSSFQGKLRKETESAYLEAHRVTEGRQVLTLFKIDRIVPCLPGDLKSARHLVIRRNEVMEKKQSDAGVKP